MIGTIIVLGIMISIIVFYFIPTIKQQWTLFKIHSEIDKAEKNNQEMIEVVVNMDSYWYEDIVIDLQRSYRLENIRKQIGHKYQIYF